MSQHRCQLYEVRSQFHPLLSLPTAIYISLSLACFFEKICNLLIPNNLSYSFLPFPCRTGKELFAISLDPVWPCITEVHVWVHMCIEHVLKHCLKLLEVLHTGKIRLRTMSIPASVLCKTESVWEVVGAILHCHTFIAFCSFLFILPIHFCQWRHVYFI